MSPAQVHFVFHSKGLLKKRGSVADLRKMADKSAGKVKEVP